MPFFTVLSISLYLVGIKKQVGQGENYLFTWGNICAAFVYHYISVGLKPFFEKNKKIADFIYKGAGSVYILGFILSLIIAAVFLLLNLEPIANQIAIIGYYLLVVGVVKELIAFKRTSKKGQNIG